MNNRMKKERIKSIEREREYKTIYFMIIDTVSLENKMRNLVRISL